MALDKDLFVRYLTYHRTIDDPALADIYLLLHSEFRHHVKAIINQGIVIGRADLLTNRGDFGYQIGITFDDGYSSDLENACFLHQLNMSAIFFIPSSVIGKAGFLTKSNLEEMKAMGMMIGSHSHTHRPLVGGSGKEIEQELYSSKIRLEDILRCHIDHFAPPGGLFNKYILLLCQIKTQPIDLAQIYIKLWH